MFTDIFSPVAGPEPKTCKSGKMSLMPQEFQDQNKTNAMLYTHGDLPILSAETYGGIDASIVNLASTSSKRADPASKKRVRTQAGSTPEPQEEKKRARGRPRLETKDETAAEVSTLLVVQEEAGRCSTLDNSSPIATRLTSSTADCGSASTDPNPPGPAGLPGPQGADHPELGE